MGCDEIWRNARVAEDGTLSDYSKADIVKGLHDLKFAVHRTAFQHGWWEGNRNFGEVIALMHSELSEALEAWRDGEPMLWYDYRSNNGKPAGDERDYRPQMPARDIIIGNCGPDETVVGKPCGVASEFADVIIRILDTCEKLNIPVTEAIIHKHNYNITRPYRHGGKRA